MEETVDAVSAVRLYDTAVLALGVLLNDRAVVTEEGAGLDERNGLLETLARGFDNTDIIGVLHGRFTNIVGLVEVAMIATMIQGDVDVEDIAID